MTSRIRNRLAGFYAVCLITGFILAQFLGVFVIGNEIFGLGLFGLLFLSLVLKGTESREKGEGSQR